MKNTSEKFHLTALSLGFAGIWAGLSALPHLVDISKRPGIERLWTDPMFAWFPALLFVIYGGTWLAKLTNDNRWLLNNSFWQKQLFLFVPILFILATSSLNK